MGTLTEKVAFVTSASAGIGHVIVERFAQERGTGLVSYGKRSGGRHL